MEDKILDLKQRIHDDGKLILEDEQYILNLIDELVFHYLFNDIYIY